MTFKVKTKGQIEGEKLLVPKLRFKEFNTKYKKYKIGDTLKVKSGKDQKLIECKNGKYPILGTGGQIGTTNSFLYDKPSVLIGRKGTINKPQYMTTPFWTVDTLFYTDIKEEFNTKYIFYAFQNINWKKYDESTGVPSLSCKTIEEILYYIPNKDEQDKISTFITLLDKKTELQQRKIEALKIYKKGLIQKYFESKNGEKIKISEILEEVINKTTENNQYDVISSTKDGLFLQSEYFNRSIASDNNIGYKILKKNQIVLSPQNLWMGNINYNNKYEIGMVSPSYKIFNINKNFDKDYISNLLKTNKAIYYYTINSEQGASIVRRNLNMESFYEINFVIPDIEEQNKKGKIINGIAQKIEKEEKKYQKLDKFKKGLLQKMFI